MIPSLLSHMSPKEPPANTLITINPLFFESSMKQCHLSKPREREMEPGGTVFTWERWPGENGEQKGVPCAEVVSCDYDDSVGNETVEWSSTNPSNTLTQAVTVAVPLLKEGPTFFFSGDYDGEQCVNGQHFKITVSHGKGLPDSLKDPSDQAPAPNAADYGSTPDTVVPFDFNNPHDQDTDVKKDSGSISLHVKNLDMKLNGILLSLGILYMF
ncbi:hypothetical protein NC653_002933 [Populus alba x Populus x berolinensis]|uniref:Phytocyanin domain-containing protein n=1 Tax=Populus alba x Populus x berolinensis TaxID=444605 RepID=A0AAD6WHJ0_9ROSI|nr:hypothetical protein NC653_002933 [Populus alba x Populus x berolinensis]